MQIPHSRSIIVGQKNSKNVQKSLPRADLWSQIPLLCPASPPLPQRLNIDRCIMCQEWQDQNKQQNTTITNPNKKVKRHFGKLLHYIYTPTFVFSQFILLLIVFSSVFIALDCSTAFCLTSLRAFMKFARSNLSLFDEGIAYPLIQPDYNLDIFSWALWFACKGKTWGISHIACKISSALSVLYLWYEGKFSKTKIIRFLPGLQRIFVCSLYQLSLRLLKTYPSTISNISSTESIADV